MMGKALRAAAFAGMILASPAVAGTIADRSAEAEKLVVKGDNLGALDALDAAVDEIWTNMPLTIRKVVLVDSYEGFGVYAPRANAIYRPGEQVVIYTEPVGYKYGKSSLGELEIAIDVDVKIRDAAGKTVASKRNFGSLAKQVRYHNREFFFTLTVDLSGVEEGKYEGVFLLRDKHSEKTAEFSVPFEIGK